MNKHVVLAVIETRRSTYFKINIHYDEIRIRWKLVPVQRSG